MLSVPPLLRAPLRITGGLIVLSLLAFAIGALATWNVNDPSLSFANGATPTNALGYPGAVFADIAMQFFGLGAVFALVPLVFWAVFMVRGRPLVPFAKRLFSWLLGAALISAVLSCITPPVHWPLPNGLGGVIGDMVLRIPGGLTGGYPSGIYSFLVGIVLVFPAIWLSMYGAALIDRREPVDIDDEHFEDEDVYDEEDEEDEEAERFLALGALTHWWYSARAQMRRVTGGRIGGQQTGRERDHFEEPYDFNGEDFVTLDGRREPEFAGRVVTDAPSIELDDEDDRPAGVRAPRFVDEVDGEFDDDDLPFSVDPAEDWAPVEKPKPAPAAVAQPSRVAQPAARPKPGGRVGREAQPTLIKNDGFDLPALHLLNEAKNVVRDSSLSTEALEQNARMLEGVLEDFGVKGEIIQVKPGPVVTLYELEPAPGIKSSRVIGLADDIARSMSAIAARVAVVPGRNAIGIELPNSKRETVYLRELLASRDFEASKAKLALSLGKTIGGEPVIADLAKMPHLLVAGTTGSGKSVAINTMILSIVYRMAPEQCRLIMIDPKMLELSVYDGIPHLLTPVVTDPKKAVVALKWTVREMEERYKKMSKLGVRNIDGFNARVEQALRKGDTITRTVQTGFDRDTGEAVYETEEFDMEAMPYIVVIIDEMADLMMVAGKDIEGAVQRLAQMARAAGIHVIMATQRPSVDVITGTIKANFPTRISFQVTSKIDSRTILGEQGAEQLLGMGDMLYMAGGGRIQRVHGPFVSDDEVEDVVAHLKTQGVPEYLDAITEDDEEGSDNGGPAGTSNLEGSDDPYDQAVAVVLRDGKASTSYIQRRLGIGYNRAASLIERMEQEGVIGPANHAGKREILVPTEDEIVGR
ncbi:DNA translocase FtsK 4TM domain-containing protein [Pararhizobium haloflavum]|uniref:DNA translocase FtsK 4TM domain-containing protein n=1 Tax=Pararhizobium haloflavum TaxID=2037914 RepID=UPI00352090C2